MNYYKILYQILYYNKYLNSRLYPTWSWYSYYIKILIKFKIFYAKHVTYIHIRKTFYNVSLPLLVKKLCSTYEWLILLKWLVIPPRNDKESYNTASGKERIQKKNLSPISSMFFRAWNAPDEMHYDVELMVKRNYYQKHVVTLLSSRRSSLSLLLSSFSEL